MVVSPFVEQTATVVAQGVVQIGCVKLENANACSSGALQHTKGAVKT
jgi:hypothetical protein